MNMLLRRVDGSSNTCRWPMDQLVVLVMMVVATASHVLVPNAKAQDAKGVVRPLRALLISGGCCHDYPHQEYIITKGISQRANVEWQVLHGSEDRDRKIPMYQTDHWTDGFDVVVHNECYGGVTDVEFIERMVRGHAEQGVPLVVIHCSMHSYRNARTDEWRKLLGVTSKRHESVKRPLAVVSRDADHPIMRGIPTNWSTPNGELYIIEHNWPDCHILATAKSVETNKDETVVWVNQYGKAKTFGTTLGHHNETMMTNEWLATVSRGLLWVCGKLGDDGTIGDGYSGTGISPIILPTVGGGSEQKPTEAKR